MAIKVKICTLIRLLVAAMRQVGDWRGDHRLLRGVEVPPREVFGNDGVDAAGVDGVDLQI